MRVLLLVMAIILPYVVYADVIIEKEMSRLKRDKTIVWADVRAESEQTAKDEAIKQLQDNVTDYFSEKGENPDAVYIAQLSSKTEILTTHTSSNRYRVFVYVRKSELLPLNDNDISGGMVLKRNEDGNLQQIDLNRSLTIQVDTAIVTRIIPPVITRISTVSTFKELRPLLNELRDKGEILHSALFPLSDIDNFYVIAFDTDDRMVAVLYHKDFRWYSAITEEPIDITEYKRYSAIWLTLSDTTK